MGNKTAIDEAIDQVSGANNDGDATNKGAPAIVHGLAKHIQSVPSLYGRTHVKEILGVGEEPKDGKSGNHVFVSENFASKSMRTKHISEELKAAMLQLKKELHNAQLQQQILAHKSKMPMAVHETPYFKAIVEPKLKAFNLTDFSDWVPTLNTRFFFEELEIEPALEKFFETVPMASSTEKIPMAINRLKGRLESDSATFGSQANAQANVTYTAQDCVCHTDITEDLMADLVPQEGGFDRLRKEVMLGVQRSKEDAMINGDDTITTAVQGDGHMDSDIAGGAATLFNKAFKGFRKVALAAGNTYDNAGGVAIATALFTGLLLKMGKAAKDKGDLLFILSPIVDTMIATGKVPEILTADKYGQLATIFSGQLPRIFGIEPYTSEWVREDVNDLGVYAAASSQTTILCVKKSRFVIGQRAPIKIWATPSLANQDKMLLTAKERFTFGAVNTAIADDKSCAIALDVPTS